MIPAGLPPCLPPGALLRGRSTPLPKPAGSVLPRGAVRGLLPGLILLLTTLAGCGGGGSSPPLPRQRLGQQEQRPGDNLGLAMQFLRLSDELDPDQARGQCAYHLNRWLETQTPDGDWSSDPLLSRVRPRVRGSVTPESLGRLRFTMEDVRYLHQALWTRDISRWVSRQAPPEELRAWLQERTEAGGQAGGQDATEPSLTIREAAAERLAVAERLFDWTVRNVQLDPLLEYPPDAAAGPAASASQSSELAGGAARGVPGPGYTLRPWQVLLYGHGDAWQRARVFIQLCQQQQIDVVMLGINDPALRPSPWPWLPAVLLDEQLYLFDTQLGLPLRGPGQRGIATLEQVLADPSLIESLDVGERYRYPVRREHLDKLVALIDASPRALSQRMAMVHQRLTGDDKLALAVAPGPLAKTLRDLPGITAVSLWELPFETEQYRESLERLVAENPELAQQFFRREQIFEGSHPLVLGRRQAFRNQFESTDEQPGAKVLFLEARLPDHVIDNLPTDKAAQERVGIQELDPNPAVRQTLLERTQVFLRDTKLAASYWLGLAQYETQQYEDAIEWLEQRTLQVETDNFWKAGARYNLGRTYEALGQYEKARDLYYAGQSAQAHGNRLRARYFPEGNGALGQ